MKITRPCLGCGGKRTCRWSIDAWVCSACGDEWYPDHGPEYADPFETSSARVLLTGPQIEAINEALSFRLASEIEDAGQPSRVYRSAQVVIHEALLHL